MPGMRGCQSVKRTTSFLDPLLTVYLQNIISGEPRGDCLTGWGRSSAVVSRQKHALSDRSIRGCESPTAPVFSEYPARLRYIGPYKFPWAGTRRSHFPSRPFRRPSPPRIHYFYNLFRSMSREHVRTDSDLIIIKFNIYPPLFNGINISIHYRMHRVRSMTSKIFSVNESLIKIIN